MKQIMTVVSQRKTAVAHNFFKHVMWYPFLIVNKTGKWAEQTIWTKKERIQTNNKRRKNSDLNQQLHWLGPPFFHELHFFLWKEEINTDNRWFKHLIEIVSCLCPCHLFFSYSPSTFPLVVLSLILPSSPLPLSSLSYIELYVVTDFNRVVFFP